MAIVYRDELNEYKDLSDKQAEKAFNKFVIEHKETIEDIMSDYLFTTNGNCYDEKEIKF